MVSWKTVPIKELYEGLYDGPHATPAPSDKGPIFLGIKNVTDDARLDLSYIANKNLDKLFDRKERGVLGGSGDNR